MKTYQGKCNLELYANFLIANKNNYTGSELEKVAPRENSLAHDSVSRWLDNSEFDNSQLLQEAEKEIGDKKSGYLIADDTLVNKQYSRKNELAKVQYSGAKHGLVNGICLVNLLWSDKKKYLPIDYKIYDKKNDKKTKNDHFLEMSDTAENTGFKPKYVLMDSWYSSLKNLKHIAKKGWKFVTVLKSNRTVNDDDKEPMRVSELDFTDTPVKKVWLRGFGFVVVHKIVFKNGDIAYATSNDLSLLNDSDEFRGHSDVRWKIEEFHRGLKQTVGIEKCHSTKATSQKTHIFASFWAFLKLEFRRIKDGISWYEQKAQINRFAVTRWLGA